jgi:cytosine/creatinine deaminase
MSLGFAVLPASPRYVLANATVPGVLLDDLPDPPDAEGLVAADIVIDEGIVERVAPPGSEADFPRLDLQGGMVWPSFVDMHTHIDKGHIWPRRSNPDGTFASALEAVAADRDAEWSAGDVARRMDFSLRAAYAHGTSLLRTHLDSSPPQHRISWPVFAEMRDRWAGRVELQAVSLFPIDLFLDERFADEIVAMVAEHGGVLGAASFMVPDLDRALEMMMRRAGDRGLDLDFHVDESGDPAACSLRHIAEAAIRIGFPGRIVAGHCCSLATQPAAEADATMERVAEAGIAVVSLPMCNMYLQDRFAGRTPRWRGVTLLHELMARDVPVAVASDNTRDPFYAYGDLDMLEVFREAVRIIHLDHPIGAWASLTGRSPAAIIGRDDYGVIAAGRPADLVLFRARTWTELLARPQADRTVLRSGVAIDRTLPDYRELDDLMGHSE